MDNTPSDQRKALGPDAQVAQPRPQGVLRFSAAQLLIALVLLIATSPFLESIDRGGLIESILWTVVMGSAAMFVGMRRRLLWLSIFLAAPAVIGRWMHHLRPDLFSGEAARVAGLLFAGFVVVNMLRYILRARTVDSETLCVAVAAFLMLGMLWGIAYTLTAAAIPHSFAFASGATSREPLGGFDAFYFSYSTLTTVGYGDITPASPVTRMLAVFEAMTGMLYVAILIARLVAIDSSAQSSASSDGNDKS